MNEHDHLAAQRARLAGAIGTTAAQILEDPIRYHDRQGIADERRVDERPLTPSQLEVFGLMLEFLNDCASPEGYGHSVTPEVVKRASRIVAMLRPPEPRCAVGYSEPPPARCEFCDSE
jgi:hypothetical protein